jgi:hypothetical protein
MPQTKCNNCGAECWISESNRDAGAEVYCSESCACANPKAKPGQWTPGPCRVTAEFTRAKHKLLNLVFRGVLDTGDRFDEALTRIEACNTADELEALEKWVRELDAELMPKASAK